MAGINNDHGVGLGIVRWKLTEDGEVLWRAWTIPSMEERVSYT